MRNVDALREGVSETLSLRPLGAGSGLRAVEVAPPEDSVLSSLGTIWLECRAAEGFDTIAGERVGGFNVNGVLAYHWGVSLIDLEPNATDPDDDTLSVDSGVLSAQDFRMGVSKADLKLKDIDGAIAKCIADGGRKGCPAIVAAEKIKKAADKDGNVKPGKAPSAPAQAGGWDAMKRAVAKTHDNSVA